MTNQEHYNKCVKLYEKGGATAVYDYANKHGLNNWMYCPHCDANTPHLLDTDNSYFCLVCGSSIQNR